jgi:DNA invertase Pin-like site-specific DNA recombinase
MGDKVVMTVSEQVSGVVNLSNRDGVQELLDAAEKGMIKKVFLESARALGRSVDMTAMVLATLNKAGAGCSACLIHFCVVC